MSDSVSYRFVIVGAGSAGCCLAQLLARKYNEPIALIEAGGAEQAHNVRSIVPNYYPRAFRSSLDWHYVTAPQTQLAGRRIAWPRGKLLGGSGAINALIYMQPAAADWLAWEWDASSVAAASQALRQLRDPVSGEACLSLSHVAEPHPWTCSFLAAAEQAGLTYTDPWSEASDQSSGLYQLTQRHGRRWHFGLSILRPAQSSSPQIALWPRLTVTKIILQRERALGIEAIDDAGKLQTIYAEDQLILCAGTLGSPLLLLGSGIGDPIALSAAGLPCHLALPEVGKNLQDHLVCPLIYCTRSGESLARRHGPETRQRYRTTGTGPLASNIAEAGALFSLADSSVASPVSTADVRSRPEFQLHFTPTHYLRYPQLDSSEPCFSLAVTDLHPRSRGQLRLDRHLAGWQVHLDPAYLSDASDCERFVAALQWTRNMAARSQLEELIRHELMPGPKRTDAVALSKWIRSFAQSIYHPIGTCRMDCGAERGPLRAVVDRDFRVHGLEGLRIVDASVLSSLSSCNTNAAVLMLTALAAGKF